MKLLNLSLAVLLMLSSFTSRAIASEEVEVNPTHYLFLIHGIGGNKSHFGYMGQALTNALNKKDPSTKYIFKDVEYDTGNNDKTPYEFAQDINKEIQGVLDSEGFNKDDKISLIMHSQGGLVGSIWMFQSMMSTPGYGTPETINHVDAFITLGTPFWGAKTAKWGSEIKNLTDQLGVEVPLPFGKRELEEMSFGSDMIFDFRNALADPEYRKHVYEMKKRVRFLNIAGVANLLNPLGIFVSGTGQYEDDGAVPLASARFNFLYSQSLKEDYQDGERETLKNVIEVNIAPYVVVNAMHRSPLPELDNFASIAQIPKKCVNDENCGHPVFPYLVSHVLGDEIRQRDETLGDFKTFLIDLNIRTPESKKYDCDDIQIELTKLDGSKLDGRNIEVMKFYEVYSNGARKSTKYKNHCRFYFTGSIKRSLENREEAVLIKVSGKNLKTRYIEMKLKESYSSYVDINMVEK